MSWIDHTDSAVFPGRGCAERLRPIHVGAARQDVNKREHLGRKVARAIRLACRCGCVGLLHGRQDDRGVPPEKPAFSEKPALAMSVRGVVETVGLVIDLVGVGVIVVGAIAATLAAALSLRAGRRTGSYRNYRRQLGRSILLGLEFFVAGDIIRTVALEPSLSGVGVLAAIVAIRTALSFSLELEITGRWPWQKPATDEPAT